MSALSQKLGVILFGLGVPASGFVFNHEAAAQRSPAGTSPATPPRVATPDASDGHDGSAPGGAEAHASHRCPDGMRLVDGEYCPEADQRCLRWVDQDEPLPMRCAEFAPSRCSGHRRHVAACMDEYEYPNRAGAYPQVMVSWYAAQTACQARGARMCSMAEWTFACEGEQMLPYPYGLRRDSTACNIDHQHVLPDRTRLANPATSADESARLYEAVPSGQYDRCVSPFGIHDMTGNADEWVQNETGHPLPECAQGRLVGADPRALSPRDVRSQRELRLLPDRVPMLRRPHVASPW